MSARFSGAGWAALCVPLLLLAGCVVGTSESDVDEWIDDQEEDIGEISNELLSNESPTGEGTSGTQGEEAVVDTRGSDVGASEDPDPEPWIGCPPIPGGPVGTGNENRGPGEVP